MALQIFQIPMDWEVGCGSGRYPANKMRSETDDAYVYSFIVPGVSHDAMDVSVYRNRLTLKVNRSEKGAEMDESLWLPRDINLNGITAGSRDGVLTVTIPKATKEKRFTVTVEDLMERDESTYEMEVEIPGGSSDDVAVEVEDGKVFVKAEAKEGSYFQTFQRVFRIPRDGDETSVKAFCKYGLLVVQVRKIEATALIIKASVPTVSETDYALRVRMPGVPIEKIELSRLGKHFQLKVANDQSSSFSAKYEETFTLPDDVETENAQGFYNNGVLIIAAPKIQYERTPIEVAAL